MKGTLKDALQYASQNPSSDFAHQLASMVKSGQLDEDAKGLGIDLTPIKSSSLGGPAKAPAPAPKEPGLIQKGFDVLKEKVAIPLAQAEINTVKALNERGKGIFNDTIAAGKEGAKLPVPERIAHFGSTVAHQTISAIAGGVGDIFVNMVSPFIPQDVKDKANEGISTVVHKVKSALDEPAYDPANPSVPNDLVHNQQFRDLIGHVSKVGKENPEITRAFGDALNVALLGGGGAAETAAKPAIESGIKTAVGVGEKSIQTGIDAAKAIESKVGGVIETQAAKQALKTSETAFKDALTISRPNAQLVEKAGIAEKRIVPGSQGFAKGAEVAPSAIETRIAEAVQPLVESGEITAKMVEKDPAAVQQIIDRRVSQINLGLDNMAAENNITFTKQFNPKLYLDKAKEGSQTVFAGDKALERAYDAAVTRFNQLIKTKDIQGVIKARKAFDAEMRSKYPNVFKPDIFGNMSPRDSAIKNAIFDIRDSANQFISDALPANNPYKALLKQESYLLRASENIGTKMKGITTEGKAEQFLDSKKGKVLKKAAIGVGVAGGTIGGAEALLQ